MELDVGEKNDCNCFYIFDLSEPLIESRIANDVEVVITYNCSLCCARTKQATVQSFASSLDLNVKK